MLFIQRNIEMIKDKPMPLLQELILFDLFELFILFGESLIVPASKDSC